MISLSNSGYFLRRYAFEGKHATQLQSASASPLWLGLRVRPQLSDLDRVVAISIALVFLKEFSRLRRDQHLADGTEHLL